MVQNWTKLYYILYFPYIIFLFLHWVNNCPIFAFAKFLLYPMGSSSSSQTFLMFPVGNIPQEALLPKDKGRHRGWNCSMPCMFKSIFIFLHTWLRAEPNRVNIIFPQNSEGTVCYFLCQCCFWEVQRHSAWSLVHNLSLHSGTVILSLWFCYDFAKVHLVLSFSVIHCVGHSACILSIWSVYLWGMRRLLMKLR